MNIISINPSQINTYPNTNFTSRKPVIKPKTVNGMLETTLAAASVYGVTQVGINKQENKEETPLFRETKSGENIISMKTMPNTPGEYITVYKPSKVAGEYNIHQLMSNGIKKILSSVKVSKSKGTTVQKNFESPSGTQSIYKRSGTDNNYQMSYIIKDKDGNTKLNFTRSFKKINDDTTETVVNGKKYINTFGILGVDSVNTTNPDDKNFMIINWQFEKNMKKLPAEMFYCMQNNNVRIIQEDFENRNNACVHGHLLKLSTDLRNDYFVFAHEMGHVKSAELGDLAQDEELRQIYVHEKEEALKNMGDILKEEADYFLTYPHSLEEVIAETYAILSGLDHNGVKSVNRVRTNLLMQYFPHTIAYIANKIYNS